MTSFDALEHIAQPGRFLARMGDFLAPAGRAVLSFGPLFHSPFGDHMGGFFARLPGVGDLTVHNVYAVMERQPERPSEAA